jgi:predicted dehydrogenase
MGDMACHLMDAAFWALGLRYPTRVTPESSQLLDETAPKMSRITYEFPARGSQPPVTLVWRDGSIFPARPEEWGMTRRWPFDTEGGQLWIGDKGSLVAGTYGENPQLCDPTRNAELVAKPLPEKYPRTEGVYKEWIDAIKGGTQPESSIPGHAEPLTEMIVLGNLAVRSGRAIELDTNTGALKTANIPPEWITPKYRAGWDL